jgi:hypothetical protein
VKTILTLLLAALVLTLPAQAGKPVPVPSLSLVSEQINNNPVSPPWCLNEDDFHYRHWSGSFSGSMSETEHFCTPLLDFYNAYDEWDGGGVGVSASVRVIGTLVELSLSAPDGYYTPAFDHQAQFMGSETVGTGHKAKTYNYYAACAFIFQNDISILTGDVTMQFSGSFSEVELSLTAAMYPVGLEPGACPPYTPDS